MSLWEQANREFYESGVWTTLEYQGLPIRKYPTDLWVYEEIIRLTEPDVIVETGSFKGGSAAWFAQFAGVISVDKDPPTTKDHWVTYLQGDSADMASKVADLVDGQKCLVSLDSDHNAAHVLRELEAYAPIATDYLIVEDTAVDAYGFDSYPDGGPGVAVKTWLREHKEWKPDAHCDRFMLGMNPGGWLKRK